MKYLPPERRFRAHVRVNDRTCFKVLAKMHSALIYGRRRERKEVNEICKAIDFCFYALQIVLYLQQRICRCILLRHNRFDPVMFLIALQHFMVESGLWSLGALGVIGWRIYSDKWSLLVRHWPVWELYRTFNINCINKIHLINNNNSYA